MGELSARTRCANRTGSSSRHPSSDAPSYESDESDGFSYSSESDDDGVIDLDDDVIDLSASTAARLSSPLKEAFRAVDPTLVWAD